MLRAPALWLTLALVIVACTPPSGIAPTAEPSGGVPPTSASVGGDMTAALLRKPLPVADLFDLTRRLRGRQGTPAQAFIPVRTTPPEEAVGDVREFWTYDFDAKKNVRVGAALRVQTDHAKWWVATDVTVDPAALQTTAVVFETRIYPTNRATYGSEWSPGIDGDPRIDILVARIPGRAAGYFSSADEYPTWVNEYSAQREMIYINALAARFGTDNLYAVLAHEFCHMQQFNKRVRSVVWFNEGQAQLCERLNNVGSGFEQSFLRQPDTQLNDWPDLDDTAILHYGGSFLFLEWLRQHAGGDDLVNALMAKGIDIPEDLDTVLRARGQSGIEEQFADFVAANALIGASPEDRFAYRGAVRPTTAATAAAQDRLGVGASFRGTVHQWAARYVELPKAPVHLRFAGARSTRLIPTDPHSGRAFWWSDRADGYDATLTRAVDLRSATAATLSFWSWYEIEKDFDYGYITVSADGGRTWTTVRTARTTTDDPNGNNLGNGLTGTSGGPTPAWVEQQADLGAFAGKQILLRFEYVTDGALNLNGWAIDDLAIPEIGWSDDAESDRDWTASGFVRSTNLVRQRFIVQIIRFGATPTIERRMVEDGALELDLDGSADRRAPLMAVTGLAPRTTQTAPFELTAEAKR